MNVRFTEFLSMTHFRRVLALVEAPLQRFAETPWWGRVTAPVGAFLSVVWGDWFTPLLAVLALSSWVDHYFGVRAAKAADEYNPLIQEYGWHSKMAGVLLAILIRLAEWWATSRVDGVDTHGALAVVFAFALVAKDIESIAYHRERLGAAPIPILGAILGWFRRVTNALLPPGLEDEPKERERERHEEEQP